MKTHEEELAELDEQAALAQAELDAMAEETAQTAGLLPARAKFFALRRSYLEKGLKKIVSKRAAQIAYIEWDRRTKP
jgi:hypothetical protein